MARIQEQEKKEEEEEEEKEEEEGQERRRRRRRKRRRKKEEEERGGGRGGGDKERDPFSFTSFFLIPLPKPGFLSLCAPNSSESVTLYKQATTGC